MGIVGVRRAEGNAAIPPPAEDSDSASGGRKRRKKFIQAGRNSVDCLREGNWYAMVRPVDESSWQDIVSKIL
jgi:hypothetical protein